MAESTDYDSNALNHEPRDTRYPYSSSEDSNDTKHEGEPKPLFEGKLKKLQLTSNRICYGPCPEPDDEVEQHEVPVLQPGKDRFFIHQDSSGNMSNNYNH